MSESKEHYILELDPEETDFEYLAEHGFDRKITAMPGFIKIWHGHLTESEVKKLQAQDWVRAIGKSDGIDIEV